VRTGFWWGKPEEKRELGTPRRRWDNDTKRTLNNRMGQCGTGSG
jgi:hypothetical protein